MKKTLFSLLAFTPMMALAHPGHEHTSSAMGLVSGALHPLLGLDHLLALLAVGLFSARLEGEKRFILPVGFIAMMTVGFYGAHAGVHGLATGTIETLITLSLVCAAAFIALGFMMKKSQVLNGVAAWSMTGFAVFHGLAHGLEVPAGASLNGFALGFLSMSVVLIGASALLSRFVEQQQVKKLAPVRIKS